MMNSIIDLRYLRIDSRNSQPESTKRTECSTDDPQAAAGESVTMNMMDQSTDGSEVAAGVDFHEEKRTSL